MHEFWNTIRGAAAEQDAQRGVMRHATVTSVDPARGRVKVSYDEGDTISGWLPIVQHAAGNGWGSVTLPLPGTQVFVAPDMGDIGHGVVLGAVHFDAQPPAKVTPYKATSTVPLVPGEPTMVHASGASIRLTAGGVIEMHGTVKIDGDLLVSGHVRDLNAIHGSLDDLRQAYNAHKHGDAQGGTVSATDNPIA
ncbi:MAG: hypothetical protein NVSMB20_03170 [Bradyrhizobium sp.]